VGLYKNNIAWFYLCKLGHEDKFYTVTLSVFDNSQQERELKMYLTMLIKFNQKTDFTLNVCDTNDTYYLLFTTIPNKESKP
jgi:hypothetical protein